MMKILLLSVMLMLLAGCCKNSFYSVSIADNKHGGIYQDARQILQLSGASYIIRKNDTIYITRNAARKSKDKSGFLYAIDRKTMQILKSINTGGITPCHAAISPDGKFIYIANYTSGLISEIPLADGIPSAPPRGILHQGKGKDLRRQKSPHPHFTGFSPSGDQLFVCDLGTDEIVIYNYVPGKGITLPCVDKLKLAPGAGPRHLAFAPDGQTIYVANELNSTATSFIKTADGWQMRKTISTRTADPGAKKNFPGAIKITSCGKYFFITNRGDDTIAMFKTSDNGNFELIADVPSQGQYPSDILLSDNEKLLLTINLKTGTVVRFKLDKTAGTLEALPGAIPIPRGIGLSK